MSQQNEELVSNGDNGREIKLLAGSICDCPEVVEALKKKTHPCHEIVMVQNEMVSDAPELRQRPEPWIGNLAMAKVLFLSSNPSISDDPDIAIREDFPTYGMSVDDSAEYFVNRFNPEIEPPHATFKTNSKADFLYRSNDGEYRGKGGKKDVPIETWLGIHRRAMEILGTNCHPHSDYALTEVVKCKSKAEAGVKSASPKCVDTWMAKVLGSSTARIVVVVGRHSRDNFAHKIEGIPSDFGTDPKTYPELGPYRRCIRDVKVSSFGGKPRLYLYNWHPTGMIPKKSEMIQLRIVYGEEMINWLADVANKKADVPKDNQELSRVINRIFNK
jgi:hypothetical protein